MNNNNSNNYNQKDDVFQESKILVSRATEVGSIVFSVLTPLLLSGLSFDTTKIPTNSNTIKGNDSMDVWD